MTGAGREQSEVWSVRIRFPEPDGDQRLGPYFSIQSARNQASRARGRGATVLGIDTGTVEWQSQRCPVHYCGASLDAGQSDCGKHSLPGRGLSGKHSFYWRDEGRNDRGERGVSAACPCGWVHMTAYSLGRRKRAVRYLHGRWITHD